MQVTQSKLMRIVYNDRINIGYIDAALDSIRTNKHSIFLVNKIKNSFFKIMTFHLSMGITNAEIGTKALDNVCHFGQTGDPVEYKKNLASSFCFKINSVPDNIFIIHLYLGLDGLTVGWRRI